MMCAYIGMILLEGTGTTLYKSCILENFQAACTDDFQKVLHLKFHLAFCMRICVFNLDQVSLFPELSFAW